MASHKLVCTARLAKGKKLPFGSIIHRDSIPMRWVIVGHHGSRYCLMTIDPIGGVRVHCKPSSALGSSIHFDEVSPL